MRLAVISLGCPKNLVDSEKIIGSLADTGIELCSNPDESDVVIINTCGFIKPAIEETERVIADVLSSTKGLKTKVYVTGCAVNRLDGRLRRRFKGVKAWFKLNEQTQLIHTISRGNISNARLCSTRGYAYLKISDGCSNYCSYCTIPMIKGKYRSEDFESLIKEASELAKLGIKELILIGQETTNYGVDRYGEKMLVPLIKELSKLRNIAWLRLLYAHPKSLDEQIIDEIARNRKVCKYLDLPIQHINDRILKLMNRKVDRKRIEFLVKQLKKIKGISLRTTVIAGFPTETDEEFNELYNFLNERYFDWLGVFPYFREPGTVAARLKQLPGDVIEKRYKRLLRLQSKLIKEFSQKHLNRVYPVLIHHKGNTLIGHTRFQAPDIDGQVRVMSRTRGLGKIYKIKITKAYRGDLYGE